MVSTRHRLIQIQKRMLEKIKREIKETIPFTKQLKKYFKEYKAEVRSFERISNKQELIEKIAISQVVYCGDYHTLKQAQRTPIRLLREIIGKREVVLLMEMVQESHQPLLDDFMMGKITETKFLEKINYKETWGFDWSNYKPIFDFAKKYGLRMRGVNCIPSSEKTHLYERDAIAAEWVLKETVENPDALIFLLYGDLHLASMHLPLLVWLLLREHNLKRQVFTIFQNSEDIYWKLAEMGMEQKVDVVKVNEEVFVINNSTPWVKLQSNLIWVDHAESLQYVRHGWEEDLESDDPHIDFHGQLLGLLKMISSFLGIKNNINMDFKVVTIDELDFLESLDTLKQLSKEKRLWIRKNMKLSKSYFIPEANSIYLSSIGINDAAAEASIMLYYHCSISNAIHMMNPEGEFYHFVLIQALGFLGSKIINPKLKCNQRKDFEQILFKGKERKQNELEVAMATIVLNHLKGEVDYLEKGVFKETFDLDKPPSAHYLAGKSLGAILGGRMYDALMANTLSLYTVKNLFFNPFSNREEALRYYLALCYKLQKSPQLYSSKLDKL